MKTIKIISALGFAFALAGVARAREESPVQNGDSAEVSASSNSVLLKYPFFNMDDVNRAVYTNIQNPATRKTGSAKLRNVAEKGVLRLLPKEINAANAANAAEKLKKSTFIIWVKNNYYTEDAPGELKSDGFVGYGTGFLIKAATKENPAGELMIMTNAHIAVNNLGEYKIIRADTRAQTAGKPFVIGYQALGDDLALIKVSDDKFFAGMIPLTFADKEIKIGEKIYILNFQSQDMNYSFAQGECSSYGNYRMQVSAITNKGSSGAAVVNQNFEVVGVNDSSANPTASEPLKILEMAVPLRTVKRFLRQVADGRQPVPPVIGASAFLKVDPSMSENVYFGLTGVRAENICDNSTLSCAGVDEASLIIAVDGMPVQDRYVKDGVGTNRDIIGYIQDKAPGDTVQITFYNPADSTIRTSLQPLAGPGGEFTQEGEAQPSVKVGGLTVLETSYFNDFSQRMEPYLKITKVDPGVKTEAQNIIGRKILRAGGVRVQTIQELDSVMQKSGAGFVIDVDNHNYQVYVKK